MTLGEMLREERERRGLSKREMSSPVKLGVHRKREHGVAGKNAKASAKGKRK